MPEERPLSQTPEGRIDVSPLRPAERQELRAALISVDPLAARAGDLMSRFLLVEVVNTALQSLSLDELLRRLVQLAVTTLDAERGTVFLHDAERDELYSRVALGSEIAEIRVPRTSGIAGAVFQSDHGEVVDDAYADPRFNATVDERTGFHTRALVCVPVYGAARSSIGVVEILNKRHGRFDRADLRLLQAIADQAAIALEHAVLYESERRERAQDLKLHDFSEAVAIELDLDRLLSKIMAAAAQLLDAERATCFIHDAATDELWSRATAGERVDEIRFAAQLGIAGASFSTAQLVSVADAYADTRFNVAIDAVTGFHTSNLLAVPLLGENDRPTGVLEVLNKRAGPFTASDERRLRSFAAQAAIAIQNAQMFKDVLALKTYTESIIKSLPDGVVTLDRHHNILKINEAGRRILQIPDGVMLTGPAEAAWGAGNPWLAESLAFAVETGGADDRADVAFALADSAVATVNVTIGPWRDGGGSVVGVTMVLQDISRQKKVRGVLSRYMAQQFAERLLSTSDLEHGSTHVATVLFSDIRRFTSIAEALTPQATVDMLNEYFADMAAVVQQHGGALDKYIGDAVMAVFGATVAGTADADNAVAAANQMVRVLWELNRRRASRGARPIEIGVGLATGEVAAGPLGGPSRMDYTVIGDSVNLASRLEGANKYYGTTVLLAASTVSQLRKPGRLRPIDIIRVKGKETAIEIFESFDHYTHENVIQIDLLLPLYKEGLMLYRKGRWATALAKFSQALKILPKDGPSWVYADRCLYFRDHPPTDRWDGIWTMATK